MFHTALLHPDHLQLRESHCCCEAGTTLPSITESARKPPLAQPAFHFLSKANRCNSPLTCSRRSGAACDTAIRVTFFVADGVTAKFSSDHLLCGRPHKRCYVVAVVMWRSRELSAGPQQTPEATGTNAT